MATSPQLQAGDRAPSFSLPSTDGGNVSLEELRGRKVALYFYPKDDTPGCTIEACGIRDGKPGLDAEGLVVLGVSADDMESHHAFIDKFGLNFPLLADVEREAIDAYGAWGERSARGRTWVGALRKTFLIDEEGIIIRAWHDVDPNGHAEDIAEAARAPA